MVGNENGGKKIEDVQVGDEVKSFADDRIVNSSASQIYKTQRDYYWFIGNWRGTSPYLVVAVRQTAILSHICYPTTAIPREPYYFELTAEDYGVSVTAEHPFYIGSGRYEETQNLKVGDTLYVEEGGQMRPKQITSIKRVDEKTDVYNMTVDDVFASSSSRKLRVNRRLSASQPKV